MEELEKQVEKLEKASYISIEIGKDFFFNWQWIGVNKILQELIEKLGYKIVYGEEIKKKTWIKKKPSKK